MKEQLISFKTAKLAKEKGFKFLCEFSYDEDGILTGNCEQAYNYVAPTQSVLQKWFREKHNIAVLVQVDDNLENNVYKIHTCIKKAFSNRICPNIYYSTYEEALEKGLQEALKLI